MTEHFTRKEAATLAKAAGFEVRRALGLRESVPEDVFARGLINEEVTALCNAAINAKQKEWEARGAVAWMSIDSIGERYLSFGKPLNNDAAYPLTHALPAQPVREPLTDSWILERCAQSWVFETAKQWVRMTEAAHGITQGGKV